MRSDFARRNEDLKRRLGVADAEAKDDNNDNDDVDDGPPNVKRRRTMDEPESADMDLSSGEESSFRPPLPPGTPQLVSDWYLALG